MKKQMRDLAAARIVSTAMASTTEAMWTFLSTELREDGSSIILNYKLKNDREIKIEEKRKEI